MLRSAPPGPTVQPLAPITLQAHGQSQPLSFAEGERLTWTYKTCAAPALATCVDLIAVGQARFTLGGPQEISQGRATGHYTFHRAMVGELRSGADTNVDVEVTRSPL